MADITDAGPRLRQMNDALERDERLRLTYEERSLLEMLADHPVTHEIMPSEVATLRGLLKRHFPALENGGTQETTLGTHTTQSEGSARPECAIAPAWMSKPFFVDPAAGWSYGFPRLYDPSTDGDMKAWLVSNGYPQYLADKNLPCTFTATIDSQ